MLASARLRGLLLNSALLTGGALAISVVPGTFLAVVVAKSSLPGRRVVEGLMLALLLVPLVVQAAAWQTTGWFAGVGGWLVGWRGAIWVHGVAAIPWVVLAVGAALRNVPRELEEETLQDVSDWRVVLQVSLRRAAAGVVAASLWIAVICFGEIAVTDLFQIRTFAEEIYTAASLGVLGGSSLAGSMAWEDMPQLMAGDLWLGTLAVLMLVLAALGAIQFLLPATERVSTGEPWVWHVRKGRVLASLTTWLLVAAVVVVPVVSLLGKAGMVSIPPPAQRSVDEQVVRQWSAQKAATMVWQSPWEHRRELRWSCTIGGAAAATMGGLLIAWALRTGRLPAWPTTLLLALGFSIPGPLLAVWVIRLLNHPEDSVGWPLTWCYDHTILAPTLVQFCRALPLATLVLWSQLASLPQDVLDSAMSEGAGWWRRLFAVALPLRWPAVVAAACLSLVIAMSDLAATLLVAPPGVATLSMRIFGLLHYGAEDRVAALC
ncbi:MAG: iron ABC transporter permease, partial [Planctomycetes bacterium]|nr:iron ABC transporter permease [Planctomycetota bacterium]